MTVTGVFIVFSKGGLDCHSNDASTRLDRRSNRGRMELMASKAQRAPRRTDALSRELIVQAATEILDTEGEDSADLARAHRRLSTGYGAIYHHVADKSDLLAAATDDVIAGVVDRPRHRRRAPRSAARRRARPVRCDRRPPLGRRSTHPGAMAAHTAGHLREHQRAAAGTRRARTSVVRLRRRARELHPRRRRAERCKRPRPRQQQDGPIQLSSPPSPHSGHSSTPPDTHPCTKRRHNCANTTTASSSSPASISSSPASRP